jgi:cytochrome oxidase Cu insertion factor (SCO1/SenC/PrrC family)
MIRSAIVAAVILGLVAATGLGVADPKPGIDAAAWQAAGVVPLPRPGQAPPLGLSDLSGKSVDLRQLRGRLVMVYFWATW